MLADIVSRAKRPSVVKPVVDGPVVVPALSRDPYAVSYRFGIEADALSNNEG
jgi:hypothetical protein